ncbi:MAG: hypothetical protein GF401_07765 [Chitinivibrionales bacterium]|nr:hypothetical protein [Chitinivibrionales bacterium]
MATVHKAIILFLVLALGLPLLFYVDSRLELKRSSLIKASPHEARAIFKALHRNIYSAFDYSTESEIYDALSKSIDGELLTKVYTEVYEGLVLREEHQGALTKIFSVDILSSELIETERSKKSSKPSFGIRCTWEVNSILKHWGHFHPRTNRYEGVYTLVLNDAVWKIVDNTILSQKRVDRDWTNTMTDSLEIFLQENTRDTLHRRREFN